jgi:hypothetical protein
VVLDLLADVFIIMGLSCVVEDEQYLKKSAALCVKFVILVVHHHERKW